MIEKKFLESFSGVIKLVNLNEDNYERVNSIILKVRCLKKNVV